MQHTVSFLPQGYGLALASVAAFWLALALPGYVLVRRLWPRALDGGGPSALALGYLWSFALAAPLCDLCYALRLPVAVLSGALVLGVLVALWLLWRERRSFTFRRPSWVALAVATIVAADLWLGLHTGSNFGGDGRYHASRVRMLLVHGFNSWDPLVPGGHFDAIYHSNVYHALIAASAQLVGLQAPAAWAFALFFGKLAATTGVYHVTWTVIGQRWIAWISSAIFVVYMAALSTISYPNTLAVYWLLLVGIAFLVEALRGERGLWPVAGLGATALVLPQVHALYYVFACLVIGPVLAGAWALARAGRPLRASARQLGLAALVLGLGLPWFVVGRLEARAETARPDDAAEQQDPHSADTDTDAGTEVDAGAAGAHAGAAGAGAAGASAAPQRPAQAKLPRYARANAKRNRGFLHLPSGLMMLAPRSLLNPRGQQFQLLVMLLAGMLLSSRRRDILPVLAVMGLVMAMLYVPPVCTALIAVAGEPWVVRRLSAVPAALHIALAPALLCSLLAQRISGGWLRLACFAAALAYAYTQGVDSGAWKRAKYLRHGVSGKSLYFGLRGHARRRALYGRAIPFDATIVVSPQRSGELVVDCDCYPLALGLDQSSHGLHDLDQRRADVASVLGRESDLSTKVAILRHYHVDRLYVRSWKEYRVLWHFYRHMLVRTERYRKDRIMVLDLGRAGAAIEWRKQRSARHRH